MSDIDLTEAAANALRTAWLNGKANTTEGWSLHGEADRLVKYICEQVAREIQSQSGGSTLPQDVAYDTAARIVRGEQP